MKNYIYNNKNLKPYRRYLKKHLTAAEAVLWRHLKAKKLDGFGFHRPYSVGRYILDFYCPSKRLCIELDGAVHNIESYNEKDVEKEKYLKTKNIKVIRFQNEAIFIDIEFVLNGIREYL